MLHADCVQQRIQSPHRSSRETRSAADAAIAEVEHIDDWEHLTEDGLRDAIPVELHGVDFGIGRAQQRGSPKIARLQISQGLII